MADEFFRPFFTQGVWANGELFRGFWYNVLVGNSSSALGVTAVQLDRRFTYGGSIWWMPTTGEFGPRGAYGDWEWHKKIATRFGMSSVVSQEQRKQLCSGVRCACTRAREARRDDAPLGRWNATCSCVLQGRWPPRVH